MPLNRLKLKLPALRLEFLLPLPLLLIAFGLFGELLTNQVLSRSYTALDKLQAENIHPEAQMAIDVLVVKTEIEQEKEFTQVEIETTNSVLKKLEFEVPFTESSQVEAAIAQELKLSPQVENLQAGTQLKIQLAVKVIGILAEIEKGQKLTKVEVKTANSALKRLEFEFPVTELSKVKSTIAQELGLSQENARLLLSYRIQN